ncbi:hypothetical protein D3C85_1867760 [compost metagenome]
MSAKADPQQAQPFLVVVLPLTLQANRDTLLKRLQAHFPELEIVLEVDRVHSAVFDGHVTK